MDLLHLSTCHRGKRKIALVILMRGNRLAAVKTRVGSTASSNIDRSWESLGLSYKLFSGVLEAESGAV